MNSECQTVITLKSSRTFAIQTSREVILKLDFQINVTELRACEIVKKRVDIPKFVHISSFDMEPQQLGDQRWKCERLIIFSIIHYSSFNIIKEMRDFELFYFIR